MSPLAPAVYTETKKRAKLQFLSNLHGEIFIFVST
jgi:hypothetical protein